MKGKKITAVSWIQGENALSLLDQRLLPEREEYVLCHSVEDVASSIEAMVVRGAPAIGIAAAYGVVLAARDGTDSGYKAIKRLSRTRPTAVNLFHSLDRMKMCLDRYCTSRNDGLYSVLLDEAYSIHNEDVVANETMGRLGAELLPRQAVVLTHCNAGAIATGGHGTALGVLRSAVEMGKSITVFASETRPLLQGARLTSWELERDGFDVTVIADSMVAFLMQTKSITAVLVGADRIANNGDVANKIGTYGLAVLARAHGIPLYAVAPWSTVDLYTRSGNDIPIEERSERELRVLPDGQQLPESIKVWNPAFDVTPARLVTALVTEKGVFYPPYDLTQQLEGLKS